jgi:hypothetical protein
VLLIKQYERNSKRMNFILNQINVIIYSYQHSMKKYLPNQNCQNIFYDKKIPLNDATSILKRTTMYSRWTNKTGTKMTIT